MATTAGQFWDKHVRDLNDRVNWWSSDACTAGARSRSGTLVSQKLGRGSSR